MLKAFTAACPPINRGHLTNSRHQSPPTAYTENKSSLPTHPKAKMKLALVLLFVAAATALRKYNHKISFLFRLLSVWFIFYSWSAVPNSMYIL